jgi:LCP family protein required for cell wall assembly
MRLRSNLVLGFLLLVLLACQLFSGTGTPASPLVGTFVAATLTSHANGSTLPAPTQTPMLTFTPTETPEGAIPPQATPILQPAGEVTILLMGSDQRPHAPDFRTDTALLVVLKTDGSVSLVSFPRDLWVYLPDQFMERINTAQEYGGFELVKSTFQYNFGFAPQSYVLTNFSGFQSIVDSLGGINVQVGETLSDARTGYPGGYTINPGLVHMDGETALWYVRSRQTTSDLDRLRRAQEVIFAIGKKLLNQNGLTRIPQLYSAFRGAIVTDLTLEDVVNFLPILQSVNLNKIQRYAISTDQVIPFVTSGGADVLLPRPDAIRQLLLQALGNSASPR